MKTRLLLVIGMLGWLTETKAQIQIQVPVLTGTVIDSFSKKPLERAGVNVVEWGKRDTLKLLTDAGGHFRIEQEPRRDFVISATFVGYQTKQIHYASAKDGLGEIGRAHV